MENDNRIKTKEVYYIIFAQRKRGDNFKPVIIDVASQHKSFAIQTQSLGTVFKTLEYAKKMKQIVLKRDYCHANICAFKAIEE